MKTKILFLALSGVMMATGANALTTEEIMARCNASKDTVWDSFNKTCIPRNPCKKDGYEKYCNKEFADVEVGGNDYQILIKAYAKYTDGQNADCSLVENKAKSVGQDYVACTYDNGHYVVFEFDDVSEQFNYNIPAKFTTLDGGSSCYGYSGNFIVNPLLPNNLCHAESYEVTANTHRTDTFCAVNWDFDNIALNALEVVYKREYGGNQIFEQRYGVKAPDGTVVNCLVIDQTFVK